MFVGCPDSIVDISLDCLWLDSAGGAINIYPVPRMRERG